MAVASVASQMAITASPVSVAVVSLVSITAAQHGIGHAWGSRKYSPCRFPLHFWCRHCCPVEFTPREDLSDDREFQEKLKDPKQREFIYGGTETLMNQRFPKQAYWSTRIFFAGIAVVVLLGAFPNCAPPSS